MPNQGSAATMVYMAYNTVTGAYVTGDVGNHTLKLVKDGTEASPTNSPSEIDSSNAPGAYKLALTSAETSFNVVWLGGKSATSNTIIIPAQMGFNSSNLRKNAAFTLPFTMTDSINHNPVSLLSISATRSLDGAAPASIAGSITEIGNGDYVASLLAADMNGNSVQLRFTASGADDLNITLVTYP